MAQYGVERLKDKPYFNNDGWWVSPYNFVDEVSSEYAGKSVAIHDVTLRDGEQTFGVAFSPEERVRIAEALDEMLKDRTEKIDMVLELQVDDKALLARIEKRAKEEGRSDDTVDALKTRIEQYRSYSAEVLPYYQANNDVFAIDGMRNIDEVTLQIEAILAEDLAA